MSCFLVTPKQSNAPANVLDDVAREKKDSLSGQMSLFDFVDETTKRSYETVYPDVGEYEKSDLLALEKEVLGIWYRSATSLSYVSLSGNWIQSSFGMPKTGKFSRRSACSAYHPPRKHGPG